MSYLYDANASGVVQSTPQKSTKSPKELQPHCPMLDILIVLNEKDK